MTIRTTIKESELKELFRTLNTNVRHMRPALVKIGGMLERSSEVAFNRQGPGWKPLSSKYKTQKIKEFGGGKKILERDGTLAGSVSSRIIGDNTVAVGSNLIYARPHQLGSPKQGIPKRPYLIVGPAETRKAIFIMSRYLVKGI